MVSEPSQIFFFFNIQSRLSRFCLRLRKYFDFGLSEYSLEILQANSSEYIAVDRCLWLLGYQSSLWLIFRSIFWSRERDSQPSWCISSIGSRCSWAFSTNLLLALVDSTRSSLLIRECSGRGIYLGRYRVFDLLGCISFDLGFPLLDFVGLYIY